MLYDEIIGEAETASRLAMLAGQAYARLVIAATRGEDAAATALADAEIKLGLARQRLDRLETLGQRLRFKLGGRAA